MYSVPGSFGGPTRKVPRKTVTGYDFTRATLNTAGTPGRKTTTCSFSISKCHDITLSRGCLIAGLPLICTERAEYYYKSMGWSSFYEIVRINTINNPHVHVLRL